MAQSAGGGGAVEYADCFSGEDQHFSNQCPAHDTKQSDGEVPVIRELWGMQSTPLLPSLPGPICGSNTTTMPTYAKKKSLNLNCFWHSTVCK